MILANSACSLLITVFTLSLFAWVSKAQAAGDLSRQVPLEVRVQGWVREIEPDSVTDAQVHVGTGQVRVLIIQAHDDERSQGIGRGSHSHRHLPGASAVPRRDGLAAVPDVPLADTDDRQLALRNGQDIRPHLEHGT